jgi:hypothetical protein
MIQCSILFFEPPHVVAQKIKYYLSTSKSEAGRGLSLVIKQNFSGLLRLCCCMPGVEGKLSRPLSQ